MRLRKRKRKRELLKSDILRLSAVLCTALPSYSCSILSCHLLPSNSRKISYRKPADSCHHYGPLVMLCNDMERTVLYRTDEERRARSTVCKINLCPPTTTLPSFCDTWFMINAISYYLYCNNYTYCRIDPFTHYLIHPFLFRHPHFNC